MNSTSTDIHGSSELLRRNERGASIAEVMVVVAILVILVLGALPKYDALRDSFSRGTAVQMVDSDLRRARNEAIAAGARAIVTTNAGGATYTIGLDRPPYAGLAADEARFSTRLPPDITLTASSTIIFDSRGFVIDQNGAPAQVTTALNETGRAYITGTLFATGFVDYSKIEP